MSETEAVGWSWISRATQNMSINSQYSVQQVNMYLMEWEISGKD